VEKEAARPPDRDTLARLSRTSPSPAQVHRLLKHLELIALQNPARWSSPRWRCRQREADYVQEPVNQASLTVISAKLNSLYFGLTGSQIAAKNAELSPQEKEAADYLAGIMQAEDSKEYQEPYLEGWHFMLNQPEFAKSERMRVSSWSSGEAC
jgi:transcriptional regulator of heat shock response